MATKTGHFDEAVVVDSAREPWLGRLLEWLRKQRREIDNTADAELAGFWGCTPSEFIQAWRA